MRCRTGPPWSAATARRPSPQLEERANRLAHHLAAQGIGERDHIAIYSYNSLEFVEAMLAAYKLRAVPINVNYRYVEEELVYLFDNADAVAVIYQAEFSPRIAAVKDRLPLLKHLVVIDDGSGTPNEAGAVELRGGAGRRRRPSVTSARATPATSTSSTRAARPASRRA